MFDKYKELRAAVEAAQRELDDEAKRLCDECAPFKVGDVVVCNGLSHRGKDMRIDSIMLETMETFGGREIFSFMGTGPLIKADGTDGINRGEFFENRIGHGRK